MTPKKDLRDTVSLMIVSEKLRSPRLIIEAVNAALPRTKGELQDDRKTHGWWRLNVHPQFFARTDKDRVEQAKVWLEGCIPLLDDQGLRVIYASVETPRVGLDGVRIFDKVLTTDEYLTLLREAEQREREKRLSKWVKQPLHSYEIERLRCDLQRLLAQGTIRIRKKHKASEVIIELRDTDETIVLTI